MYRYGSLRKEDWFDGTLRMSEYQPITEFRAFIRRPQPRITGMLACLFGENGECADKILILGRSEYLDALVDVALFREKAEIGGFQGYVRRPRPLQSGMVAQFFAENGGQADAVTAMSLSKHLDTSVLVVVRLIQDADGRDMAKRKKGPHGQAAAYLWRSGFFRSPTVWILVGTEDDYATWIREQKCCVDAKQFGAHEGDVVAAHVERVATGSGTSVKSPWGQIPVCHHHHSLQHQQGESAVGGKAFYDKQRIQHVQRWAAATLAKTLGFNGISWIPPDALIEWAAEKCVDHLLPARYMNHDENR